MPAWLSKGIKTGGRERGCVYSEIITKLLVTDCDERPGVGLESERWGSKKALESAPCRSALFLDSLQMLHPN